MEGISLQRRAIRGVIGVLIGALCLFIAPPALAQYIADYQTNIIAGGTGTWSGSYIIGSNTSADCLLIEDTGALVNGQAYLGYIASSSSNSALVSGTGSVWSNTSVLHLGHSGVGNSLVISDGGRVVNSNAYIGFNTGSTNNSVLITGSGSVWNNNTNLYVGYSGGGNSVVISNGGKLTSTVAILGQSSIGNNALITGIGSIWSNDLGILIGGNYGTSNSLVIANGGQVVSQNGYVGSSFFSRNNTVLVTDPGSVWGGPRGGVGLGIGSGGVDANNSLVISNGGEVISGTADVGTGSSGNSVLVTGTGSVWSNGAYIEIGWGSQSNDLVINNGGYVISAQGEIGMLGGSINDALVTDVGSIWRVVLEVEVGYSAASNRLAIANGGKVVSNTDFIGRFGGDNTVILESDGIWSNGSLNVGYQGSRNSLIVDGGSLYTLSLVVGGGASTCDNFLELNNGSVVVTNGTTNAVLEVAEGQLILNGGTLYVDNLVITNSCASFIHTGGTLLVGRLVLDPNTFRITAVAQEGNNMRVTYLMGPGQTNALQATAGDGSGGYNTNGFEDIFVVTNNPAAGTVTNYLDVGGATNAPARYYRMRLVP